jgi:hypothetical protein
MKSDARDSDVEGAIEGGSPSGCREIALDVFHAVAEALEASARVIVHSGRHINKRRGRSGEIRQQQLIENPRAGSEIDVAKRLVPPLRYHAPYPDELSMALDVSLFLLVDPEADELARMPILSRPRR